MKALIIGAAGFVGGYLADHLRNECGWSVCVTKMPQETCEIEGAKVYDLDILEKNSIKELFEKTAPDYIFHLAAQSSVAVSWKRPELTVDVNVKGCVNVLEAARELVKKPRILLVGSSEEYGPSLEEENPVTESQPLRPGNIYAATKACQGMLGSIYAKAYQMDVIMVRAFNHIGPKQAPLFVVSDFCKQVAEIEKGIKEPAMYVGNLSAKRDFTDVRDIVRAYSALVQKGIAGETYNVGSGHAIAIQDLLNNILKLSTKEIKVEVDPNKLRPVDVPIVEADVSKLTNDTGWERKYELESTLKDILEYWRGIV
ncbi:MAG: GDP-mannose 4,6-dehydratase [Lachnospiraceae bacterium]|nr:GDP-mannose 4,6-dehydratase [Lachnospiraceae bacterium]MBO5176768.1 GDP-mannose 4,6-dehydratase [Lachnospiraceae bacterium]